MVVVAACQIPAAMGSNDHGHLVAAVREAAARGACLVVLPELAVCGYAFRTAAEARAAAQTVDGPTVALFRALSRELGVVLVCGFAESGADGEVHNAAVLVEDGDVRLHYRMAHLWGREPEFFRAGDRPPAVVDTAERAIEVVKAQAAAGTNRVHVVVADRCGEERGVQWIGGSLICADTGYLLAGPATATGTPAAPVVLTAELDPVSARDKALGPHDNALHDRRPELYLPPT